MMQLFTLIEKKQLTHDVFELIFESENKIDLLPGQFITFILDKI
jgi:NAD(P)H-flavin reductase